MGNVSESSPFWMQSSTPTPFSWPSRSSLAFPVVAIVILRSKDLVIAQSCPATLDCSLPSSFFTLILERQGSPLSLGATFGVADVGSGAGGVGPGAVVRQFRRRRGRGGGGGREGGSIAEGGNCNVASDVSSFSGAAARR